MRCSGAAGSKGRKRDHKRRKGGGKSLHRTTNQLTPANILPSSPVKSLAYMEFQLLGLCKHNSCVDVRSVCAVCPYLDEPPYDLWGVFGQRLHFAMEDERHQDVFLIGFQHDVAHRHGWSGYCLRRESERRTLVWACDTEKAATETACKQRKALRVGECGVPVHKNTVLFQSFWGPCRSYHRSSSNIKSALRRMLRSPYRCPSCPTPRRAGRAWNTLLTSTAARRHTCSEDE